MGYTTIQSTTAFEGRVFNVRRDTIQSTAGRQFQIDVVEHGGAVAMIPLEPDHSVWFVRQYRHPIGEVLLEIPAGTLNPGETPERAAARECREEIGLAPAELIHLGETYLAPGYSSEYLHVFLARRLTPSPLPQDEDEELQAEKISWERAWRMLVAGELHDAKTIVGLTLARTWLEAQLSHKGS